MIEAKASRTFIRIYSLFKPVCLSANIKLTLHKALITSNDLRFSCLVISGQHLPLIIGVHVK
jgi:hypothetical protein